MDNSMHKSSSEWYKDWFNSKYYHILYKNRDYSEAELFISNLTEYLNPSPSSKLLDAACGKGRHAVYLANLGFEVDAFDLSPNNIAFAKQSETDKLKFYINDIRVPLNVNHYDYVFNLFTSFGYFETTTENSNALSAIGENLKTNGTLVLDFMNSSYITKSLPSSETKQIEGIDFSIQKTVSKGYIVKNISFSDQEKTYQFEERVKIISKDEFETYFDQAGLKITQVFGDYELSNFDESKSDRLIFVAVKQ